MLLKQSQKETVRCEKVPERNWRASFFKKVRKSGNLEKDLKQMWDEFKENMKQIWNNLKQTKELKQIYKIMCWNKWI